MKTCFRCQEPEHICECDDPIFTKKKYIEALEASLVKDGEALTLLHAENEALKELNEKLILVHTNDMPGQKEDPKEVTMDQVLEMKRGIKNICLSLRLI